MFLLILFMFDFVLYRFLIQVIFSLKREWIDGSCIGHDNLTLLPPPPPPVS